MGKEQDSPKIVDVSVEKFDGVWNNYKATAIADTGKAAEGFGVTQREAINCATSKARRK